MKKVSVFYKRELIGFYEGEFFGDDFCILEAPHADGFGTAKFIANVLYDSRARKAGLEFAWIENIHLLLGFVSNA